MSRTVLKNGNLITHKGEVKTKQNIEIINGKIVKVTEDVIDSNNDKVIDCTGLFISPGFVNMHVHSPMTIFRGIAEDVHVDDWFNEIIWPYEMNMTGDDVYVGAKAAICEMLENGVTAFADHYLFADRVYEAVEELGIKADIAITIFGMTPDYKEQLENAIKLIQESKDKNDRVKYRMGPHAGYTCPDDTLKEIIDTAKDNEVGIHIHVSETKEQVERNIKEYGNTPFKRIHEAGGFDTQCIIGHGLWIEPEDRKLINENTYFAACPKTYMKLDSGIGHLWENTKELQLCTGTDGAASSNTLDPLEQGRLFGLIGKLCLSDATQYKVEEIWQMLMRGHEALDFNSGKVEEGYSADLLIWDLNKVNTSPLYNPLAAIIYSANQSNILYNMVNGKCLKENGQLTIDTKEIQEELKEVSKDILSRGRGKTELLF